MARSKECLQNGGLKGCWIGCRTGEGKGEDLGELGERTDMKKWNGDTYSTEIGEIGKRGKQDAVNGDSRNKAAYIYLRTLTVAQIKGELLDD